jgi:hypothetical protein
MAACGPFTATTSVQNGAPGAVSATLAWAAVSTGPRDVNAPPGAPVARARAAPSPIW